jgi:hypothetical protein
MRLLSLAYRSQYAVVFLMSECLSVNSIRKKEGSMKSDIDRIQVILGGVFFLGCIILGVFFLSGKLRIANDVFYATMFIIEIAFLYTGLRDMFQSSKKGVKISWYKQPWILVSIFLFAWLVMLFISNYSRIYG